MAKAKTPTVLKQPHDKSKKNKEKIMCYVPNMFTNEPKKFDRDEYLADFEERMAGCDDVQISNQKKHILRRATNPDLRKLIESEWAAEWMEVQNE